MTLKERSEMLIDVYGGLRRAARQLDMDPAYLLRLKTGERKNPSEFILAKLGLKRKVVYELK